MSLTPLERLVRVEQTFSQMIEKLRFFVETKVSEIDLTPAQITKLRDQYQDLKSQLLELLP